MGGDINDHKIDQLLKISTQFAQIVTKPTRGSKILSVIVTDLGYHYHNPVILPPLQPDVLGVGHPSDHCVPFARVHTDKNKPKQKHFTTKKTKSFPESGILEFANWIQYEDFSAMEASDDPTEMVEIFENIVHEKVNTIFPDKEIKIYNQDKEFMTNEMRKLRRQKKSGI